LWSKIQAQADARLADVSDERWMKMDHVGPEPRCHHARAARLFCGQEEVGEMNGAGMIKKIRLGTEALRASAVGMPC
jgi:hypothetical protein